MSCETLKRNSATPSARLSGSAVLFSPSGHLENKQVTVMMYLFPLGVTGRGPMKSTPTICQTSSLTGMGRSLDVTLLNDEV